MKLTGLPCRARMTLSMVFVITWDQFQIGCFRSTDCDLCPDRASPTVSSGTDKRNAT
jgi:hypothetical protein